MDCLMLIVSILLIVSNAAGGGCSWNLDSDWEDPLSFWVSKLSVWLPIQIVFLSFRWEEIWCLCCHLVNVFRKVVVSAACLICIATLSPSYFLGFVLIDHSYNIQLYASHSSLFCCGLFSAGLTEQIKLDRYLYPHFRYYMREVRTVVYSQFLESYKSVTIEAMAKAFGVTVEFIDV